MKTARIHTHKMAPRALICAVVCGLALATLVACGSAPEPVALGAPAPDFSLASLDGAKVEAASLAGRPVVLNFWATWCLPCRKEIPELQELAAESELQVVGIALDEEGATSVAPFVEKLGIDYLVLLGDQSTFQRFNGYTIPYTLLLGADREVLGIYRGPTTREAIERDLGQALQRAGFEPDLDSDDQNSDQESAGALGG